MEEKQNKFPNLPKQLVELGEMACDLWWSWHPAARMLFKTLDRQAWKESVHNPVKMLRELPQEMLEWAANDPEFLRRYDSVLAQFQEEMKKKGGWFKKNISDHVSLPIAYFSAEYGLHRSLPFYAGGLGFLAGDHIKECSDLGIPLVAIGFMYPEGYLHQRIREDGWQEKMNEILDRDAAPIEKVINNNGGQLIVKVPIIYPPVYVAVWKIEVGRISIYLMDTDTEVNDPWNKSISTRLYAGNLEQRLRQEIVLGIGGTEVLNTLGIKPSVLHLNEGHPAFALLELIRERIQGGMSCEEAARQVRATSIFTTHTPVLLPGMMFSHFI